MSGSLFTNSLSVASLAALLSVFFGLTAALCAAGLSPRLRWLFVVGAVVTLALPPFLVTNSWLHFFGPTGVWRGYLPFAITSVPGTAWVLSLMLWPITMLCVLSSWDRLESPQLESDLALAGWRLFTRVLLPLCRGALGQAAVLTFVLAFNNFSVSAILQVKTFPSEAWIKFNTSFDTVAAALLSLPALLVSLIVLGLFSYRGISWPRAHARVCSALFRRQIGAAFFGAAALVGVLVVGLSAVLPLLQILLVRRTWTELPGALAAGQTAIWNSFWLPLVAATAAVSLGLLAHGLRSTRQRFSRSASSTFKLQSSTRPQPATFPLLDAALWLPFLLPGVVLGVGFIALFNHSWLQWFYQSAGIVLFALLIRYLAIPWNIARHAFHAADPRLADAACLEGASRAQVLRHAYFPQVSSQLAASWYIVFLLTLWDVESILLVLPPRLGETLAVRIFNLLHYGHNAQVNALCLTMLALALLPLVGWLGYGAVTGRRMRTWKSEGTGLSGEGHAKVEHRKFHVLLRSGLPLRISFGFRISDFGFLLLLFLSGASCTRSSNPTLHSNLFSDVRIIGTRGVGVGQLNKPRSVAVDAQDNLYVVDMTGRVQKFSSNGVFLLSWQMPQTDLGKPKGMCRDRRGNIIVVEPHYSRVNDFSPEGLLLGQWGLRGTNDGQLSVPRAIGIDSHNEAFVTEYLERERVQKFSLDDTAAPAGPKWLLSFGKPGTGPGEFNRPEGLCVDSHDQIYVADSCNHRIQIFSADGKLLRMYGKPGKGKGELSYPYDICVDSAGRQYVCEFGNSRIQVFDAHDQPIEILGERGGDPGQFSNPWGVALDSAGNLYVADSQNHRVQKLIRRPESAQKSVPSTPTRAPAMTSHRGSPFQPSAATDRRTSEVLQQIFSSFFASFAPLCGYSDFFRISYFGFRISR